MGQVFVQPKAGCDFFLPVLADFGWFLGGWVVVVAPGGGVWAQE